MSAIPQCQSHIQKTVSKKIKRLISTDQLNNNNLYVFNNKCISKQKQWFIFYPVRLSDVRQIFITVLAICLKTYGLGLEGTGLGLKILALITLLPSASEATATQHNRNTSNLVKENEILSTANNSKNQRAGGLREKQHVSTVDHAWFCRDVRSSSQQSDCLYTTYVKVQQDNDAYQAEYSM